MNGEHEQASGVVKVAVPMAGGTYSSHFGAATEFWIFEGHSDLSELKWNVFPAPKHEPGALPRWLAAQRVDALIISQIGQRALIMLADAGITVFVTNREDSPASLVRACLQGRLPRASQENSCCGGHHHDHDHGHDHDHSHSCGH